MSRFEVSSITPHRLPRLGQVNDGDLTLDLSGVEFFRPSAAVALGSRVALFVENDIEVSVVAPEDESAARYASRMRIPEMIQRIGGSTSGFPAISSNHIPDRILELQLFHNSDDLELLADQIGVHVSDEVVAADLQECLFEIGQNVYQHSGQTRGFVAAQYYPAEQKYRFAIADSGQGLRASLTPTHGPSDDASAIDLAVTKGISSTSEADRGLGLSAVRRLVTNDQGWVSISSGRITKEFNHPVRNPRAYTRGAPSPGTLLECGIRSRHGKR